jgi:hypothetical protein
MGGSIIELTKVGREGTFNLFSSFFVNFRRNGKKIIKSGCGHFVFRCRFKINNSPIGITVFSSSEIKNGIILRSGRLPESLPAPDKIDLLLTNKGTYDLRPTTYDLRLT